jgi:hypothetical protein
MKRKPGKQKQMTTLRDFLPKAPVSTGMVPSVLALALLTSAGCAHVMGTVNGKSASDQVIKADVKTGDPLTALEQELTKVHSERVIVSTALLKSLVKNERVQRTTCKNISGQLEAIKNIDLEETGEELKE